jgi:predicted GTPase
MTAARGIGKLMEKWRLLVLAVLAGAPMLVLAALGVYFLWLSALSVWIWWSLVGCLALASLLGWHWRRQRRLLHVDFTPPLHWTERDRQAWRLVEERARQAERLTPAQLTNIKTFQDTAEAMALELARFYHPSAKDPVGALTIPEILAVVELAARDLAEMVDEHLPGGHLLTINDLRRIKKATEWYQAASNISWLISAAFTPVQTAIRFLAMEAGLNRPWQLLQANVLLWFFTAYIHRLGTYLIDLNSGRLRVGAERYLQLQEQHGLAPAAASADPAERIDTVTFTLVGQTKAGKSSLINALLGEQKAKTDVLPMTANVERYELQPPGIATRFVLLDTAGYGNHGPRQDQKRATEEAARQSDLVILVLHALNPARQADLDMLEALNDFFERHPDQRKPPMVAVLTHIDLLSPALEWTPPYDWRQPRRPKEEHIRQALQAVDEQFGPSTAAIVPVCTATGKVYGVQEWLLPAMVELLDQAHAVAFLRCVKAEANTAKIRKVFHQLLAVGKGVVKILWQGKAVVR